MTLSKSGVSASYGTPRAQVTVSKRRGAQVSFKLFGIRFGGRLF